MIDTVSFRKEVVPEIGDGPRWTCEFPRWRTDGNRRVLERRRYVVSSLGELQPHSSDERWECIIDSDPIFISEKEDQKIYAAYPISCLATATFILPFELVVNKRSGEEEWQAEEMEGDRFFVYIVPRNAIVKPRDDEPVSFKIMRRIYGTSQSRRQVFLIKILTEARAHTARAA